MHCQGDIAGLKQVTQGVKLLGRRSPCYLSGRFQQAGAGHRPRPGGPGDRGGIARARAGGWGELATHSAMRRGLSGVVHRRRHPRYSEIKELGFPAWARVITPTAGSRRPGRNKLCPSPSAESRSSRATGWSATTTECGDPAARAVEIANRSMDVLEYENRWRKEIHDGKGLVKSPSWPSGTSTRNAESHRRHRLRRHGNTIWRAC